jgi:hypothetical protein
MCIGRNPVITVGTDWLKFDAEFIHFEAYCIRFAPPKSTFGKSIAAFMPESAKTVNSGVRPVHLLVSVPPHVSVSELVKRVKGRSSRRLLEEYTELRRQYWGRHLCSTLYKIGSGLVGTHQR